MMLFRILGAVLTLVILTPIILLNIWGINMSLWVNDITKYDAAVRNGEDIGEMPQSLAQKLGHWYSSNKKMQGYFSTDTFSRARSVNYSTLVDIDELLKPGEARPEEMFYPLYVKARMPLYLNQFCQEILETVGKKCAVGRTSNYRLVGDKINISGDLYYLPKYDLGTPQNLENSNYNFTSVNFSRMGSDKLYPLNTEQNRNANFERSLEICAALRKKYGNCVIKQISFRIQTMTGWELEKMPERSNPEYMQSNAEFMVYMPVNKDSLKEYHETVETLASAL